MKRRRRLKITLTLFSLLVVGSFVYVLAAGLRPTLGLDLAGGTQVVLTAPDNTDPAVLTKAVDIVRSRTDGLGVAEPEITVEGNSNIVVQLPGLKDEKRALEVIGTTAELGFRPVTGVTQAQAATPTAPTDGETPAGETPAPTESTPPAESTPPTSGPQGAPAPGDTWRIQSLQAQTPEAPAPAGQQEVPIEGIPGQVPGAEGGAAPQPTPKDQITADQPAVLVAQDGGFLYLLDPEAISGREVKRARAEFVSQTGVGGEWQVKLTFTGEGEKAYQALTGKAACNPEGDPKRQIAIVLDGEVVSAPQVATDVQCNVGLSGESVITLGETDNAEKEAKDLALVLTYGSLPVELERSNIETVSATLGRDSLRAVIIAGIIGLILVAIFALALYRIYGFIVIGHLAVLGMMLWTILCLASKYWSLSLTLPGLAAIVVSIGIGADSAIVFVERAKDELREGRTMRAAFEKGFQRSWHTVVAADTVSLLAAVTLYFLAVGSVKGFVLMLGITTLLDLVISWFFKRPATLLLSGTRLFAHERWLFWRRPAGPAVRTPKRRETTEALV